jgi:hypothetical protein
MTSRGPQRPSTLLDSSAPCALQTVYVALQGEEVDAWRPVDAVHEGTDIYRLSDAQPHDEAWAFPPGSRVRCERRTLGEGAELVAVALATRRDAARSGSGRRR